MIIVFSVLHILSAIALVFIVLLQTGRGSEIGAAFGSGASQTIFGSSGSSGFMTRITTVVVILFMLTSVILALMYSKGRTVPIRTAPAPIQQPMQQKQGQPMQIPVPIQSQPVKPAAPAPGK